MALGACTTEEVESLPSKHEALSPTPVPQNILKRKKKEEEEEGKEKEGRCKAVIRGN
jgi:hypothetical protein